MGPRNWLGVAFIFLFLPVNIPLWVMLFEAMAFPMRAEFLIPVLFIAGILLLFYPSRGGMVAPPDSLTPLRDSPKVTVAEE